MKKKRPQLISLLLCIAMLFCMTACGDKPVQPDPSSTPEPVPTDPPITADAYIAAVDKLLAANDLTLELEVTTLRTVSGFTFEEISKETVTYQNLQSDDPIVLREQEMTYFDSTLPYDYLAGGGYVYIDELYAVPMDTTAYIDTLIPIQMITPELYATLSGDDTRLEFADATAAESWLNCGAGTLTSASAVAEMGADSSLTGVTCKAAYSKNAVDVTVTAEMTVKAVNSGVDLSADIPANTNGLTPLSDVRIVDFFYRAMLASDYCGAQSSTASSTYVVEAGSLVLQDTVQVDTYGTGNALQMRIDNTQDLVEAGSSYRWHTLATYKDGVYRVESDGQVQEENLPVSQISAAAPLTSYIMEPDFLATSEISEILGCYLVEFTGADWMGSSMDDSICNYIYQDNSLLDSLSTAYETTNLSGYLSIDADSMLPVGFSLEYAGKHTIEGSDYAVSLSNLVNFNLTSDTACKTLTGENPPVEKPSGDQATPLLYHVTGTEDQEMWLFGTIHVGDDRTAFLPQALYDAFDASDALALEFNTRLYEEQMETDPELQSQISSLYYYTDMTTAQSHLDPEVYAKAVKAMKATGNYSNYVEYIKPALWESSLSVFLNKCAGLYPSKGLENRLLDRAEESGKEVREVESALSQTKMTTGFSDSLQEWLLEDTLQFSREEYTAELTELYELWCAGDEEALVSSLYEEGEDLTAEEQALYDEYLNAMEIDRNAAMHDVAVSYLESGDTVFYAVGLAHLIGTDGLVYSLRDAGYTVEAITY